MTKGLTAKQRIFIAEYIRVKNGTEAYRLAGYKVKNERSAEAASARLLSKVAVRTAIEKSLRNLSARIEASAERVIRELARMGFSDFRKLFDGHGNLKPIKDMDDDIAAAIASIEIEEIRSGSGPDAVVIGTTKKVKLWDKNSALEKLCKHLGLFKEQLPIAPSEQGNVNIFMNMRPDEVRNALLQMLGQARFCRPMPVLSGTVNRPGEGESPNGQQEPSPNSS